MPLTKDINNQREVLKWITTSFLFSRRWELVIVTYNVWNKHLNPFFKLHEASEVLSKNALGVWSDDFTAAFFVSFNVIVFVPDIGGIQNKVMFINWNNLFSECN